jgi:hypothetical protein
MINHNIMNTERKIPNAEKWTDMYTLSNLYEIKKRAKDATTLYLGRALADRGLYAHVWCYWKRKWKDHEEIMDMIYNIEALFEAKLYEAALHKRVSARIAMMGLKRNHGWKEEVPAYEPAPEPEVAKPGMLVQLGDSVMLVKPGKTEIFWREGESPREKALLLEHREQRIENNDNSQWRWTGADAGDGSLTDDGELDMET